MNVAHDVHYLGDAEAHGDAAQRIGIELADCVSATTPHEIAYIKWRQWVAAQEIAERKSRAEVWLWRRV